MSSIFNIFGGGDISWTSLVHHGPIFIEYIHKMPFVVQIRDQELDMNDEQKYFFAELVRMLRAEVVSKKKREVLIYEDLKEYNFSDFFPRHFLKNFCADMNDIKNLNLTPDNIDKISYAEVFAFINTKQKQPEINSKHLFAELDGNLVKIMNPYMERPNIFRGRGTNELQGRLKRPLDSTQITINISKNKMPPEIRDVQWKDVIEDHSMFWIAHWRDPLTKKQKYIWLEHQTSYKKDKDTEKFDLAVELSTKITDVRAKYMSLVKNGKNEQQKQIGVCVYFIDVLGLRVGSTNEVTLKNPEKDSLGLVQLRARNVKLGRTDSTVEFDFFGKDKVRYQKKVQVPQIIFDNMSVFLEDKDPSEKVFQYVNFQLVNEFLDLLMPGLTAKVFRTFRASHEFTKLLSSERLDKDPGVMSEQINVLYLQVAKILNHNVYKSDDLHKQHIKKIQDQILNTQNPQRRKILETRLDFLEKQKTHHANFYYHIGTIKGSYIDPRVLMQFIKKNNLRFQDFYTKTELNKFLWAYEYVQQHNKALSY